MASGFDSIDSQTLAVAIQIYLDDVNDFKTHRKGKNRQDDISDEDVAVEAWQAELQAFSQLATDRVLCESIARAVGQDADLIEVSVQEDIQAAEDRNTALRMSGQGAATGPPRSSTPALPDLDEELEVKLRELNLPLSAKYDSQTTTAEPSSADATRKPGECRPQCCDSGPTRPSPQVACIACSDAFAQEKTWHVPCGHDYCHGCIKTLVTASIADESLFPPRCCNQALPLLDPSSAGFEFLPAKLRLQLISKKDEFETVDRTYCHIATCSTFLSTKADIRSDIGDCPACHALTCAICKGAAHDGGCPKDTASQEVLRIARENGWQQCHGCKRLVELDTGCNHMTCICGAQFCYVCGTQWRNCSCPQWNEERLYARAATVVDRNRNVNVVDRDNLIRRERNNLIHNHECAHANWGSRSGRHRCEECHDMLPYFIYECLQCRIMACRRCRFNRL